MHLPGSFGRLAAVAIGQVVPGFAVLGPSWLKRECTPAGISWVMVHWGYLDGRAGIGVGIAQGILEHILLGVPCRNSESWHGMGARVHLDGPRMSARVPRPCFCPYIRVESEHKKKIVTSASNPEEHSSSSLLIWWAC